MESRFPAAAGRSRPRMQRGSRTGAGPGGRIVISPWARSSTHRLSRLGLALAGSTGKQGGALPSFLTSGRQVFFAYTGTTGVDRRVRWSPQAFFYRGPFGGYAEYVHSRGEVQRASTLRDINHEAWQLVASWVVTGEAAGERNVRPHVNFDPPSRHWGALQIAGRYQSLRVSPEARQHGLATAQSSGGAKAVTLGVNWYLNPFVKWNVNFERTVFDDTPPAGRPTENAFLLRAHLGF